MNHLQIYEDFEEKVLYIFDFDNTLVDVPSFEDKAIQILKEDVDVKGLLQSSVKKINKDVNDLRYENGKIYIPDPSQEIDVKSNWVRKGRRVYLIAPDIYYVSDISFPNKVKKEVADIYNKVENKCIVTGRAKSVSDKVRKSLKNLGLDDEPKYGLFCYPSRKAVNEKIAVWKSNIILELIKTNKFKKAIFYDDNHKWLRTVKQAVNKNLPEVNFEIILIK